MREKRDPQISPFQVIPRNEICKELEAISKIIDENPEILDQVQCDLIVMKKAETGRMGMTAEQVFRCAIVKQYRNLTYEEMAFHLEDSKSFRTFAKWYVQKSSKNGKIINQPLNHRISDAFLTYGAPHRALTLAQ